MIMIAFPLQMCPRSPLDYEASMAIVGRGVNAPAYSALAVLIEIWRTR